MILHKRAVLDILAPPLKIYECSIMLTCSIVDPIRCRKIPKLLKLYGKLKVFQCIGSTLCIL